MLYSLHVIQSYIYHITPNSDIDTVSSYHITFVTKKGILHPNIYITNVIKQYINALPGRADGIVLLKTLVVQIVTICLCF